MLTALLLTVAFAQAPHVRPELRTPKPTLTEQPAVFTERPSRNRGGTSIIAGTARDPEGRMLAGLVLEAVPVAVAGEQEAARYWPASLRRATRDDPFLHSIGYRLTETDGDGRFAFDELEAGRAYRVVHAGAPRLDFESDELRAPLHDVELVLPQHRVEVELRFAPGQTRGDAVPYCRRIVHGPRDRFEELQRTIDAPLHDGAGTWTFEVEAGERYTIGFADTRHSPVEREVEIVPGRYRTPTTLDIGPAVDAQRLVVRVTSPEGKFDFDADEMLRFSVLSEARQELWTSAVNAYGGTARSSALDGSDAIDVAPPDPPLDSGTAFDVPPGRYIVRVEPYRAGWRCSRTFWSKRLYHASVERHVSVGDEGCEVLLPLPSGGRLHLHVQLPGAPSAGSIPGDLRRIEVFDERPDGSERIPFDLVPGAWSAERPSGMTDVLPAGRHDLRVEVQGCEPARVTVEVIPNQVRTVELLLAPSPARR